MPCAKRLIDSKIARVVYGMADKHESVYGHASLVEAGIEIGFFPNDLMQELLALNKEWSDLLRVKPIVPPNDTSRLANVSYYKLGTSGRGHAAGVEEPLRQTCFDPLLTLPVSDESEAVLQKPNLRIRCQVLREIA